MSRRQEGRLGAGEHFGEFVVGRRRLNVIGRRTRRAVHAEDRSAVEIELDTGRKGGEEGLLRLAELRCRPVALVAQLRPRFTGQMGRALEEPAVPVSDHHGAVERLQPLDRRPGLRSCGNVAEADEPVDARLLEILEDGLEGEPVAVEVGDQPETHGGTIRP